MQEVKGKGFRVYWRVDGRRRSKLFRHRDDALLAELKLRRGELKDLASEQRENPLFSDFADRWCREYCRAFKHETQWRKDRSLIDRFLAPPLRGRRLQSLRKADLEEIKAGLRVEATRKTGKPLTPRSVNLILGLAKRMMTVAAEWGLLASSPWAGVKLLRLEDAGFRYWTAGERDRFLAAAAPLDPEFSRAVLLACHTGLRVGELIALRREHLDFERGRIWVAASYDRQLRKLFERVKGGRAAEVPMNSAVRAAFLHLEGESGDTPVLRPGLLTRARPKLGRLCRETGTKDLRFHDLRHTFASTLAMAGVDLMTIQKLCRHRNYQMTLRYAHLHPDYLRGATEVLTSAGTPPAHLRAVK